MERKTQSRSPTGSPTPDGADDPAAAAPRRDAAVERLAALAAAAPEPAGGETEEEARLRAEAAERAADESARKDQERIARIQELGKAAGAPAMMVRHFVAKNASPEEAFAAFEELARTGSWGKDKNLPTFHREPAARRRAPAPPAKEPGPA
jgi:hypothetical protein